jgi:hypothetical protein
MKLQLILRGVKKQHIGLQTMSTCQPCRVSWVWEAFYSRSLNMRNYFPVGIWLWWCHLGLLGLIWLQCYYCVVYDRNSAFTLCWMPTGSFWHKRVPHIGTSTMYEKLTPMCTIPHAWIKNIFCVSSSQNFARSLMRLDT